MFKILATFRELLGFAPTRSGGDTEIQLRRIQMGILEMEDVLFHLNSCVMMPEAPAGSSSEQGEQGTTQAEDDREGEQETFTGLRALGAVYRRLEAFPSQSILIAGHTDTSGGYALNFGIADQRARNVRYLLEGEREAWAEVCRERQKVEDHQQILKWLFTNPRYEWDTDPGEIDDAYGNLTEGALARFIEAYNAHYAEEIAATESASGDGGPALGEPTGPERLAGSLVAQVRGHGKHDWPVELWRAIFDLYQEELASALDLAVTDMPEQRSNHLRWADERHRLVACGESFPIDDADRDSYRSQKNRRVEILFFEAGEAPVIDCPLVTDRAHTREECPIWHQAHFTPVYIDPYEIMTEPYFLKFIYFDRVHGTYRDVPRGLRVKAFGHEGAELRGRRRYHAGVYEIQIYRPDLDQDTEHHLHFGFDATDQYIYTADTETDAEIRTVSAEAWAALSEVEKNKHHDLPRVWLSLNWFTRDASSIEEGDLFQARAEAAGVRPWGTTTMTSDAPLVFNLDDIVLLDELDGTQAIQDADGHGTAKALGAGSRVKVLRVDPETAQLKLFRTDDTDPKTARVPFARNCVTRLVPWAKLVLFREDYFVIGRERTAPVADVRATGELVGARIALRNADDLSWEMQYYKDQFGDTGDFQAHYFHHLHRDGEHPTSYLIYHVSINFMYDCRDPWTGAPRQPAAAEPNRTTRVDLERFTDLGVYDAMDHWNRKNYWLEDERGGERCLRIRPLWVFDEKETFIVDPADAPSYSGASPAPSSSGQELSIDKARDLLTQDHASVTAARTAAFGGQARWLAFICRDDDHPSQYGLAYAWSIRGDAWCTQRCTERGHAAPVFSVLKLNKSAYVKNVSGPLTSVPVSEYGESESFGIFTLAHELGHATGQPDEYIHRVGVHGASNRVGVHGASVPAYKQFYEPYTMSENETAMMYHNGAPRLHYLWYLTHYLQEHADRDPLRGHLGGIRFNAHFAHGGTTLGYTRNVDLITGSGGRRGEARTRDRSDMNHPVFARPDYQIASSPETRVSLGLHWIGQDEAAVQYMYPGQRAGTAADHVQAVLTVRHLLQFRFDDHGTAWSAADKRRNVLAVNQALRTLSGKYRLVGGTGDVRSILILVYGGFSEGADSASNHIIRWENRLHPESGQAIVNDGRTIKIGNAVTANQLKERLFNKQSSRSWLQTLGFVTTWVNSSDVFDGAGFTLERIRGT